jgi:putative flippase GtrA
MAYQGAAVAGFVGGVSTAYILSVRWAFNRRSIANPQLEFLIFLGVGVAGLGLTEALLWLQIGVLGVGPLAAKLLAAVGVFLFNFGARKALLFTRRATRVATAVA